MNCHLLWCKSLLSTSGKMQCFNIVSAEIKLKLPVPCPRSKITPFSFNCWYAGSISPSSLTSLLERPVQQCVKISPFFMYWTNSLRSGGDNPTWIIIGIPVWSDTWRARSIPRRPVPFVASRSSRTLIPLMTSRFASIVLVAISTSTNSSMVSSKVRPVNPSADMCNNEKIRQLDCSMT